MPNLRVWSHYENPVQKIQFVEPPAERVLVRPNPDENPRWRVQLRESLETFLLKRLPSLAGHLSDGFDSLAWAPELFEAALDEAASSEMQGLRLLEVLEEPERNVVSLRGAVDLAIQEAAVRSSRVIHFEGRSTGSVADLLVDDCIVPVLSSLLIGLSLDLEDGGSVRVSLQAGETPNIALRLDGLSEGSKGRSSWSSWSSCRSDWVPISAELTRLLLENFGVDWPDERMTKGGRLDLTLPLPQSVVAR